MDINKSSRHSKITGDCGESLILYWLSKHGFECALVDHTGIDIIARRPKSNEVMGISVKSRCRNKGTESDYVSIKAKDISHAREACSAFKCVPYFAIVVDAGQMIRAYILPLYHFLEIYPLKQTGASWKMNYASIDMYEKDPSIMVFEYCLRTQRIAGQNLQKFKA